MRLTSFAGIVCLTGMGACAPITSVGAVDGGAEDSGGDGDVSEPSWRLETFVKARVHESDSEFGTQVAWLGNRLIVGAPQSGDCADPFVAGETPDLQCSKGVVQAMSLTSDRAGYELVRAQGRLGFGRSLAVSDQWVVVGAPGAVQLVGADVHLSAGEVAIYRRVDDSLVFESFVTSPSPMRRHEFGRQVAVDGSQGVILERGQYCLENESCSDRILIHVLSHSNGEWIPLEVLKPSTSGVPYDHRNKTPASVSLKDGLLIVGLPHHDACSELGEQPCPSSGAVFVFVFESVTQQFVLQQLLVSENPADFGLFGHAVAVTEERLFVGAPGSAEVEVFDREGSEFIRSSRVSIAEEDSGFGFALAARGTRLVVGAPTEGNCLVGVNPEGDWDDSCNADDRGPGAMFVYEFDDGSWTKVLYAKPNANYYATQFGTSVAIGADAIVVGAPNDGSNGSGINNPGAYVGVGSGAAYVFGEGAQ